MITEHCNCGCERVPKQSCIVLKISNVLLGSELDTAVTALKQESLRECFT